MSAGLKLNGLCVRCSEIVSKAEILFNEGTLEARNDFYSLPQWRKNAMWCHLCALSFHQAGDQDITSLQALWDQGQGRETIVHVEIGATARPNILSVLFRCNAFPILSQLYVDLSQESQQQVLGWLKECKDRHPACEKLFSRSSATRQLPTRLLDIGISDTQGGQSQSSDIVSFEHFPELRLCNTDKLPLDTQYVTLSHCWGHHPTVAWGRHPAITLTNEVLDAFYIHVPLWENTSPESRTFKHAAQVVRDLGYRFLWIDALCINQDDPKDKADEISIMDEIYANAAFNISATASSSGSGGLIYSRNPLSIEPVKRWVHFPNGRAREMIVYSNRWRQEIDGGFVNTRAWVFQERILATRVVHFAHDQVFWECATMKAARSFPRGMPFGIQSLGNARDHLKNWHEVDILDDLEDWETVQEIWASLIPLYSQSNLSFEQDKLPAISGIARRLQKLTKLTHNDYLAGLWRPGLVDQLLWRTDLNPNKGRSAGYRAPSWSWACLNAVTYLNTRRGKGCAVKLVDVNVKTKSTDTFSEVRSGSIRLSGPLCIIICTRTLGGDLVLEINGKRYPRQLIQTDWDCIPAGSDTQESVIFNDFSPKPLYLLSFYPYPERAETLFGMTGLILEATEEKAGQFERLGLFKLWQRYPEAHDVLVEAFKSKTLRADAYVDFDGKDRYCIELV